ncbi:purine-nucleoside phosphorylase [Tessaracoccus lapidicaptus]|uniref:purine-nucleoside phosphorylase n=1 Tax=Tessaracoccus lapidicaptus TaxID=1427523 RepID=UPI0033416BD5
MGTHHIGAELGEIASAVIMPGDPRRAQRIAESILINARQVSDVRGMLGFTGTVNGEPLTVMASGMGMPSATLYATELFREYGVKRIIRVGTTGAIAPHVKVGDTVIATNAHTTSSMNQLRLPGYNFSAASSFELAVAAHRAIKPGETVHVGTIVTDDHFYLGAPSSLQLLGSYGVLGVDMESAGIWGAAAEHGREALTVLTVSDHLLDHSQDMSALARETQFQTALDLALAAALG